MKTLLISILMFGLGCFATILFVRLRSANSSLSQLILPSPTPIPRPLDAYTFEALSEATPSASPVTIESTLKTTEKYTSYLFSYDVEGQKVTGQLNRPVDETTKRFPTIVMIRGYVDPAIYQTGIGTKPAAAVFAENGFVTFAPDFLGYGGSEPEDADVFAARVKRPVTVLALIESIKKLPYVDPNHIFIWGHSNGGQIALSVLEITGRPYPTVLWAPVSKSFPYNVLYYTDEGDDLGKGLRKALAKFETLYDVDLYSIHKYFDRISAPIQIHQGFKDDAVPKAWTDSLVKTLKGFKDEDNHQKLDVNYFTYPASDHNLRPDWDTVVARDVEFFKKYLR